MNQAFFMKKKKLVTEAPKSQNDYLLSTNWPTNLSM